MYNVHYLKSPAAKLASASENVASFMTSPINVFVYKLWCMNYMYIWKCECIRNYRRKLEMSVPKSTQTRVIIQQHVPICEVCVSAYKTHAHKWKFNQYLSLNCYTCTCTVGYLLYMYYLAKYSSLTNKFNNLWPICASSNSPCAKLAWHNWTIDNIARMHKLAFLKTTLSSIL